MPQSADRDDVDYGNSKTDREREHDRRNRSQLELLKLAYERKRHRDYIDELRRRVADPKNGRGDDPEG